MPLIIVFHFTDKGRLPVLSKEEFAEIRKKFLEVLKDYPDVTFYGTWIDDKGMGICLWEAPSADVVKEIVKKALGQPPVDPVIEVRKVL
ncbi:MAG: DUF4242 domain-containing protein [Desulfurococcales archaeon]|nr:DUF4242 domain-containing protein [Desulfurococcales archaeon]